MKKRYLWCLLLWGLTSISSSQELSTSVFPSEDELREALNLGEIDPALFVTLQEVYLRGIDSSRLYELDGIPDLCYIAGAGLDRYAHPAPEQITQWTLHEKPSRRFSGFMRHRYYQYVDPDDQSRYRTSGSVNLGENWRADFAVQREYSRRERIVSRSVSYRAGFDCIQEVIIGTFSRRLGLGTVYGYRGKLLRFSDRLDGESFMYPDYGGNNGLYFSGHRGSADLQGLISHNRDANHALVSLGSMCALRMGAWTPGIIVGVNRLRNRRTGAAVEDIKLAANLSIDYSSGHNTVEVAVQSGTGSAVAVVDEGRHQSSRVHWRYALWAYGDGFIDISSGSKAGGLSRPSTLDRVEFDMSDRRQGQEGGLVKSTVALSPQWHIENSLLAAAINDDTLNMELLVRLSRTIGPRWAFWVDFLGKLKRRYTVGDTRDDKSRRIRCQVNYASPGFSVRSHIGHVRRTDTPDMLSLFVTVRTSGPSGRHQLWSDISRYNIGAGRIDYYYGFISNKLPVHDGLWVAAKISHSYNRAAGREHVTVVSAELEAFF